MRTVGGVSLLLLLLLVLLDLLVEDVGAELRPRDPELEEQLGEQLEGLADSPLVEEKGNYPARIGNRCAFVQRRVASTAVVCGTEQFTIRSQSRCPRGAPDCQLVMYKLSTRPTYRQQQQVVTTLLWRCCPGHSGPNCDHTVADAQMDSGSSASTAGTAATMMERRPAGVWDRLQQAQQQQRVDTDREQSDHQSNEGHGHQQQHKTTGHSHNLHHHHPNTSGHTYNLQQQHPNTSDHAHNLHPGDHHLRQQLQEQHQPEQGPLPFEPHPPLPELHLYHQEVSKGSAHQYPETTAPLPVPHMMALVMSQLQPVLQAFNRSLEHLSHQVGTLIQDVAELKNKAQLGAERVGRADVLEARDRREEEDREQEVLSDRIEEVLAQVRDVQLQVDEQRSHLEERLHSQHAMLHYNLTIFKTDMDMKIKRQQKMLQTSLQAVNTTLEELKQDRDKVQDELQVQDEVQVLKEPLPPSQAPPAVDTSALWEAIERLDAMVVNHTVKLDGLQEDLDVFSGDIQQFQQQTQNLEKSINQTARTSQVQFMETGLEVEAAKVVVLQQVGKLASNMSRLEQSLQKTDNDVDYLYKELYEVNCGCTELKATVARLEASVANVSALANENRLALESNADMEERGRGEDWEPMVTTLQQEVQQVAASVSLASTRTEALESGLDRLNGSLQLGLSEVASLKAAELRLNRLSASFNVLLKDASRHSQVLELLLGEDVLDFLDWPVEEQEEHSMPALLEQLRRHSLSIEALHDGRRSERQEDVPVADQPDSSHFPSAHWNPDITRIRGAVTARERQLRHYPAGGPLEHGVDGSDLWKLEKRVEELQLKFLQLEEKQANVSAGGGAAPPAGLQAEVMWLKKGLEDHLRVFKNVFRNADVLVESEATLELDKLWQLVKRKEKKKKGEGGVGGSKHRSRRDSLDDSMLLLAMPPLKATGGVFALKASADRREHVNTFTAPVGGTYLLALSLDLRPGSGRLVVLRRGGSGQVVSHLHQQVVTEAGQVTKTALVRLKEGEGLRVELIGRVWSESEDNLLAVLLLQQAT